MKNKDKTKNYKKFQKNYYVWRWWVFGIFLAVVSGIFAAARLPLWSTISIGSVALVVLFVCLIESTALRWKIDEKGITFPISLTKKKFFSYGDIDSVQIRCATGYTKVHTAYLIKLTSDLYTLNIKTLKEVVDEINTLSKDCDSFQIMVAESLKDAEK